jgi:predicted phosphate transport protein (TIGR00153 family)
MRTIAKVFGQSPFIPMQLHMEKVAESVNMLPSIFVAYRQGDSVLVRDLSEKISRREHEADQIKNDIRNSMPRGLFMPVDRTNLERMISIQDSIANCAEDIGVLLTFKQAGAFEGFAAGFDGFLNLSLEAFGLARNIIEALDELLETGFGGVEAQAVRNLVDQVATKEHETDVRQQELVRLILKHEQDISYGDFYLWTRIIQKVAAIADRSENLALEVRITLDSK